MTSGAGSRALVLDMLLAISEEGQYSHIVLRQVLEKYQYLPKRERAFITRLTEGTLEQEITLDYVINAYSRTKVHKMKPVVRNILRMGCYQLLYMDAVPDSAVCNEAVKLTKKRGLSGLSGFVNGVLRTIARESANIPMPDERENPLQALSIRYSVPEWIVREWLSDYGRERTVGMLGALQEEPKLTIRLNPARCTADELARQLAAQNVQSEPVEGVENAFVISGFDYLASLEAFRDGCFYVQDIGSMQAAAAAAPKQGDYIIDVCAAPGGKSTHLAQMLEGTGMVEARDLTDYKVGLIEENILKYGLTNIKAVRMDAAVYDEASRGRADILMCDLPCSGLGVMGRKTDIRCKMTLEKADELVKLQRRILDTVCAYVKPGGTMVYSTCTVRRAENEENVAWFLSGHPEFALESMRQIFPKDGHDGFFVAKLAAAKAGEDKGGR